MCPFYSEWSEWNWEKEGNRENPTIAIINNVELTYDQQIQYNQQGHKKSYSCEDTCGKRIKYRERNCYEVNLKYQTNFTQYDPNDIKSLPSLRNSSYKICDTDNKSDSKSFRERVVCEPKSCRKLNIMNDIFRLFHKLVSFKLT